MPMAATIDIQNRDCLEFLSLLPDESLDLIFTSPPYNIGSKALRKDGFRRLGRYDVKSYSGIRDYPDAMPEADYQDWQVEVLGVAARKLKPTGVLAYNHKSRRRNKVMIDPMEWLLRVKTLVKADEVVWDRGSTHNHDKTMLWPTTERIYILRRRDGNYPFVTRADIPFRNDLWRVPLTNSPAIGHAAPFPLSLAVAVVEAYSRPGELICDPFSGSGTTALAALTRGRRFTGCELKADYCAKSIERVRTALEQAERLSVVPDFTSHDLVSPPLTGASVEHAKEAA
jgi:DNA modification methylase